VTVLGSLNTDISLPVPHLPGPGETVLALAGATIGAGGKGANQAVAAARLGASARMVGCRGGDDFGDRLWAALASEGVDTSGVRTIPGSLSGLALITVDPAGENAIAVAAGANGQVGATEVASAFAVGCDVLVLSAEVPASALAGALREARTRQVTTLLNLAPVPEDPGRLLAFGPDWLVVNAQEAGALVGRPVAGAADAETAAVALASGGGAQHVVVTLGPGGAVLAGPGGTVTGGTVTGGTVTGGTVPGGALIVPGFQVDSVDSVGAGDAFVGALAAVLAAGHGPAEAVRAACAAGAAAATKRGAQAALPRPQDVLAATGLTWPVPAGTTTPP
jgi:ribokinase